MMIFALISAVISILISFQIYHGHGSTPWGCEMSWMTPSYSLVPVEQSSRYRLYLYREQGWDSTTTGRPILFIPGNAGSYQQVRSIASLAARLYPGALDFYTVDLNEELSALYGPILDMQAAYVRQVIEHIQNAHQRPVTLLGHSMGGIVSRLAAKQEHVDLVMTMSTPHTMPPLPLDHASEDIFRRALANPVPFISICGGVSDTQVVSDSCAIGNTLFTTGLAGVWTGVDHQAMVWCHQIRSRIVPLLLQRDPWTEATVVQEFRALHDTAALCKDAARPGNDWVAIPWPQHPQAFPLPGQGIAPDEVAWLRHFDVGSHRVHCDGALIIGNRSTGRLGNSLYHSMELPVSSTSLISHRLALTTGHCPVPPLIRHTASCASVIESKFGFSPFIAHNHVVGAPFQPHTCHSPLTIDIINTDCEVSGISYNIDWRNTLSQTFQRYRMATITWTIGWHALLVACDHTRTRTCFWLAILLVASVYRRQFLIGLAWWRYPHALVFLSTWTFGIFSALRLSVHGITPYLRVRSSDRLSGTPTWIAVAIICTASVLQPPVVLLPVVLVWLGTIAMRSDDCQASAHPVQLTDAGCAWFHTRCTHCAPPDSQPSCMDTTCACQQCGIVPALAPTSSRRTSSPDYITVPTRSQIQVRPSTTAALIA